MCGCSTHVHQILYDIHLGSCDFKEAVLEVYQKGNTGQESTIIFLKFPIASKRLDKEVSRPFYMTLLDNFPHTTDVDQPRSNTTQS